MNLRDELASYVPYNEQEARDRRLLLGYLERAEAEGPEAVVRLYGRDGPAHMTASAWVVSPDRQQVLMAYHNIYQSWSWLGGHVDGELDLRTVALREVREESGLTSAKIVRPDILSVEVLCVDGHEKHGAYVSSHLHLNVTYLLEADDRSPLHVCEDENKGVSWFSLEDALAASTEPWFVKRIYQKLNDKLKMV